MTVYFYTDKEEEFEVCSIEYDGFPCFNVGQKITLQVNNNRPDIWDVDPVPFTEFEIVDISHNALKYYGSEVRFQVQMHVIVNAIITKYL